MADIHRILFARHLRSTPTSHIVHSRRGRVVHSGPGIAFSFRALNAAISEVPIAENELSMLFGARTFGSVIDSNWSQSRNCSWRSATASSTTGSPSRAGNT